MEGANKMAGWNFDIRGAESIQLAKYETGAFYNWHRDGGSDSLSAYNKPDNDFLDGRIRKLSMAILLNDDYEGGKLQFCSYGNEGFNISTPEFYKAGSIIVFPSFMDHRVSKVTKGTRYSLVVWFVGPPFK
jgi:PKHD-type hydroxylase